MFKKGQYNVGDFEFMEVRENAREWGVHIIEEGHVSPINKPRMVGHITECEAFVVVPGKKRNVAYMVIEHKDFEIATGPIRGADDIFALREWAQSFNRVASGETKPDFGI